MDMRLRSHLERLGLTAVVVLVLTAASPADPPRLAATGIASHQTACRLASADSAWAAKALAGWQRQSAASLHAPPTRFPILVLFDSLCSHTLAPALRGEANVALIGAGQPFVLRSGEHGGSVRLPDGDSTPARLVSFASRLKNGDMFLVMSLPSIWRSSGRGEVLANAVFMHEFTHTQSPALGSRVDGLIRRGLPESVDDDIIQKRFDSLPAFRREYEVERDLLFQSARAPTRALAATTARRALAAMDRRRARFFRGRDALYADAEDVFLSMEGTGQWSAYLWLIDPAGGAMPAEEASTFIRRGGRRWSQDEGLALLLVLSRLAPESPRELFGPSAATVLPLLRAALKRDELSNRAN
ncbi:MAG: hypothetical protein JWL95_449 [Gemmatimonadetes bacterium]|nr:hypothetical protein [Gemmatimonadota bacterium]